MWRRVLGSSPLYFLNPPKIQDRNVVIISCVLNQSIMCQQRAECPIERQGKTGGTTHTERGTLGKSKAEDIHHQVVEEVECIKLRRGNQPHLRHRIV